MLTTTDTQKNIRSLGCTNASVDTRPPSSARHCCGAGNVARGETIVPSGSDLHMLTPGETVRLHVEKPAVGGRMIARLDGRVVLVSGAIPGESVTARIDRVAKNLAYAETVGVEEPSPDRRGAAADLLCGGCLYAHMSYPRQLALKALVLADAFARIGRIPLPFAVAVAPSPEEGYRMRARLHVRSGRAGFFREGTHDLCAARQTGQLLAATCDAVDRVAASVRALRLDSVREIEVSE